MSNGGIGNGKCWEFQNQSRLSSDSRRCSSNSAQYGYISSQPSQPAGVSIENGLGKSTTSALDVANRLSSPRADGVKSDYPVCPSRQTGMRVSTGIPPVPRVGAKRPSRQHTAAP